MRTARTAGRCRLYKRTRADCRGCAKHRQPSSSGEARMTLNELLPMLDGVRQRGARFSARCPAHDDHSPSLSVSEGEKGLLLRCWANCTLDAICASLGIKTKDL